MACGSIFDAFRVATDSISEEIYRRSHFNSALMNLAPKGVFPKGQGTSVKVITIEPNELGTEHDGGTAITQTAGTTGRVENACSDSWTDLSIGFSEQSYSPYKWGYRGPIFCRDEHYFTHNADEFINGYLDEMANAVQSDFESWIFYQYARRVPIYVARSNGFQSLGTPSTSLTAPVAVTELTQDHLDTLATHLVYRRAVPMSAADGNGWVSWGSAGPVFSLLSGAENTQRIIKNNSELREDLRNGSPDTLLSRLGANIALKNFRHVPWTLPMRFTHDGTKYNIVPRFKVTATTKGTKSEVNDAYISPLGAPYEAALVLSPDVFTQESVQPDSTVGGVSWPAANYMGEWKWVTGTDAVSQANGDGCIDPLNDKGRHFARFRVAARPGRNPYAGAIIFYKRCPVSFTTTGCS